MATSIGTNLSWSCGSRAAMATRLRTYRKSSCRLALTNSCCTDRPLGVASCRSREPVQNWHAAPRSITVKGAGEVGGGGAQETTSVKDLNSRQSFCFLAPCHRAASSLPSFEDITCQQKKGHMQIQLGVSGG